MFTKWVDINVCHFLIHLIKMMSYNTYPILLSDLPPQSGVHLLGEAQVPGPEAPLQVAYNLNVVQTKR